MTTIKLNFIDDEEAREFLGQLTDGWGENFVQLEWQGNFFQCDTFDVALLDTYDDYEEEEEDDE